jgi:hypothetical protein
MVYKKPHLRLRYSPSEHSYPWMIEWIGPNRLSFVHAIKTVSSAKALEAAKAWWFK